MSNPYLLYDSVFLDGTPTATSTAAGDFSVLNVRDYRSYTHYKAAAAGTIYITVDTASTATAADTMGIYNHNLGTAASTIAVECSTNNSTWAVALAGFTPTDDYAIMKPFTEKANFRYWRLKMETAAVAPQCAIAMIGSRITFPNKPLAPLSKYSMGMETVSTKGKAGHILGQQIRFRPLTMSFTFPPSENNYTWWATTFKAFYRSHQLKPFFFCLDYDNFPGDVFWVSLSPGQKFELQMQLLTRVESFNLSMEGVAE